MKHSFARQRGLTFGALPTGERNTITDVPGVTVGHADVRSDTACTGVTVLLPCVENPFLHKLPAAAFVLNGFGKSTGLMQLEELGTLETPIVLTNTLNVGLMYDALVDYTLARCQQDGEDVRSLSPLVCECNDGTLNRIADRAVKAEHFRAAVAAAAQDFEEGSVGAGTGMICHGLKGGIGSASRVFQVDGQSYTLGVLVLTNHGRLSDLTIGGQNVGAALSVQLEENRPDKGSCIVVAATDLPLDARQLKRVVKRASVGLARIGSYIGGQSGEVFLGFSTANAFDPRKPEALRLGALCSDSALEVPFSAMADCTQEAVLNALFAARTTTGYDGTTIHALSELRP